MNKYYQLPNNISIVSLKASNMVKEWKRLVSIKKFSRANNLCEYFIQRNKKILKKYQHNNSETEYYQIWRLLVFVKSLQDFTELSKLIQNSSWYKNHKLVEEIWRKKCDCVERLDVVLDCISGEIINEIQASLSSLELLFEQRFGDELYASPGLIIDKFICNICEKDTRACHHISGKLYEGRICKYKPFNIEPDHVALVKNPKDKRCRV